MRGQLIEPRSLGSKPVFAPVRGKLRLPVALRPGLGRPSEGHDPRDVERIAVDELIRNVPIRGVDADGDRGARNEDKIGVGHVIRRTVSDVYPERDKRLSMSGSFALDPGPRVGPRASGSAKSLVPPIRARRGRSPKNVRKDEGQTGWGLCCLSPSSLNTVHLSLSGLLGKVGVKALAFTGPQQRLKPSLQRRQPPRLNRHRLRQVSVVRWRTRTSAHAPSDDKGSPIPVDQADCGALSAQRRYRGLASILGRCHQARIVERFQRKGSPGGTPPVPALKAPHNSSLAAKPQGLGHGDSIPR